MRALDFETAVRATLARAAAAAEAYVHASLTVTSPHVVESAFKSSELVRAARAAFDDEYPAALQREEAWRAARTAAYGL